MTTKLFISTMMMLTFSFFNVNAQNETSDVKKADIQLTPHNQLRIWYLDAQNEKVMVKIHDLSGELVDKHQFRCTGNMKISYDLSKLSDGNYFVSVNNGTNHVCAKKVTIKDGLLVYLPQAVDMLPENFVSRQ
jgi:hypothetical protein